MDVFNFNLSIFNVGFSISTQQTSRNLSHIEWKVNRDRCLRKSVQL